MKYLLQKTRLQHLMRTRNGYLALASGSLLLNVLLSLVLFCMIGQERVLLVPPNFSKSFWVSASHASPDYLSEMGLFFASLRLNVTPKNAKQQRDTLLRYVEPKQYASLKTRLQEEESRLIQQHVTTAFYPVDVKVNAEKSIVRIIGDMHSFVGDAALPIQRVTYDIHFAHHQGRLLVSSFQEVKTHG